MTQKSNPRSDSRRRVPVEGHPGIYKFGNRYQAAYRHRGAKRFKSFRTLTEAKRFKGKAAAGEARPTSAKSFQSYALEWVEEYRGRNSEPISEETRDYYRFALRRYAIPFFRTTKLGDIGPAMLRRYVEHLEEQRTRSGERFTLETIRRYYVPVGALLATATEDELIPATPKIRIFAPKARRPAARPALTGEQTAKLLAEVPEQHADLVLLIATTGARISEALTATYAGLGSDHEGRPTLRFAESKTEAGLRPIPLTPATARMLERRRALAAEFTDGPLDDELIFPSKAGTVIDRRGWTSRVFKKAAARAGVEWATPHMLRHGVASLMAERGYEAHDIARMLRHADGGALAQRVYIHPRVRSVEFLDEALAR